MTDPQPDRPPGRLLFAYCVVATVVIVAVLFALGGWVAELGLPWPLAFVAGAVAYPLLRHAAAVLSVPVLGWVMRRRVAPSQEFAVDVDGETLVYTIDEGPVLERLKAWCAVHGLEPERVVVPQTATIRDGYLTLELYRVNADGHMCVDSTDDTRAARSAATVRLMDNPPDCWIRREVSRHAA